MRVLIVGGGIGGLTAARALLDAGLPASVIERRGASGMLSGPGGIFIQKNAMRVFEKLDGGSPARRPARLGDMQFRWLFDYRPEW
jgi:2-polyprenyl-6-methoxyphenol hydroxylase-like FAD-dependent oxidoreductase